MLPDHFCDAAGAARDTDAAGFIDFLRNSPNDPLDGLLSTEDGKAAAAGALGQLAGYSIRVVRQLGPIQEKYCKVHIDGQASPVLVALLGDCEAASYPTDMENLIYWAIVQPGSVISSSWRTEQAGAVLEWRRLARGLAVVAEPIPIADAVQRSVAAIFGLEDGGLVPASVPHPIAGSATEIHFGAPVRSLNPMQARLVFEAVSTDHPKWRLLSLYRILENAYLSNIKKVLVDEFDKDAGRAVEEAKRKLQSEVNQLVDLMTEGQLEPEFITFNAEFDALIVAGNQFSIALDRTAQGDPLYRAAIQKKAVLRFYKMRCSIAHAGTSSVIYEQLVDANSAAVRLLPSVEAIVMKSLAITLHP